MVVFSGAMMSGVGRDISAPQKKGWREKVWWRLVRWSKEWHHQKNWIDLHHTPGVDFVRTRESIRAPQITLSLPQINQAIAYQIGSRIWKTMKKGRIQKRETDIQREIKRIEKMEQEKVKKSELFQLFNFFWQKIKNRSIEFLVELIY